MQVSKLLQEEFEQEAVITKKFLDLVPDDKLDWQPHKKSMTLKALATHLAEIPGWPDIMIHKDELDFQVGDYQPTPINNTTDLTALFESSYHKGKKALENTDNDKLKDRWIMRNGDQVLLDLSRYEALRHCLNQITHHRAQLGVYLRLLDIPIPGSYGPSADDPGF